MRLDFRNSISRRTRLSILLTIAIALIAPIAVSQEPHMHEHTDGGKLGSVKFPVSCAPALQPDFNRAVAMLHSFWYEKSAEAFAEIARKDPQCAMAYWGQAMSLYHPLWEKPGPDALMQGRHLIEKAHSIGARTEREREYIAALGKFYADHTTVDHLTRTLAYESAMELLHSRYPDDREARVFYSLSLLASAGALPADKTYRREKRAAAILNEVLAKEPQHPGVAHYLIHAYDSPPLASLALDAARSYSKIAPAAPHALHMPSHIFTRLGLWPDSIASNIDSESAAKKFAADMHMNAVWDEQLHAMDYLMYAYLQSARDEKAKGVLEELRQIKKTSQENFKVAYAFAAIPSRYAIERRQWAEAAALIVQPAEFPWSKFPWAEAIIHSARGIGAARSGDIGKARESLRKLDSLESALIQARDTYWAGQVKIQKLEVAAWIANAEKKSDEAISSMRSAADLEDSSEKHPVTPGPIVPAREMLGDLLLEIGQPASALPELEAALRSAPNRFSGLLGAARAAKLTGDAAKALGYYSKLTGICSESHSERAELDEARTFLRTHK